MFKQIIMTGVIAAGVILSVPAGQAFAADPIVGNWRTESGETANIAPCSGNKFCITLRTGKYAGTRIGSMANVKGAYKGKITDPATDKTYSGKASIAGTAMKMSGCVLGGLFCKSQSWNRK
tara:strand:+ start:579 stop:941 length:363 start_codon:yes stop_codon:yes gene_type:complete